MKTYLKVDFTTDDDLITSLIKVARERAELYCNRSFITKTIEMSIIDFDSETRLPYPEIISITEVKVDDAAVTGYTEKGLTKKMIYDYGTGKELYVKYEAGSCSAGEKLAIMKVAAEMYKNRDEDLSENAITFLLPHICYQ
jgi:hypothetical protein